MPDTAVEQLPPDIRSLAEQLAANEREAEAIVEGLSEEIGTWPPAPGAWSVAECLDHLAVADRVYVAAMRPVAERARERGRWRRGPAAPGVLGGLFVRSLEPPPRPLLKLRAPRDIRPRTGPPLGSAYADFAAAHCRAAAFLLEIADLDLATIRFGNPFVRGLRWSLATGMHVIAAHERRHLWQARRARRAVTGEAAPAG